MPMETIPIPKLFPQDIKRFWSKVDKRGPNECWPWKGAPTHTGYGAMRLRRDCVILAHRVSAVIRHKSIPDRMMVLHHCDNRICVNPKHLFFGTRADNIADMIKKGRKITPLGEQQAKAKLTNRIVLKIRKTFNPQKHITAHVLAKTYSVGPSTIWRVVSNKGWKHI